MDEPTANTTPPGRGPVRKTLSVCGRGLTFRVLGRDLGRLPCWCWRAGISLPLVFVVLVALFGQTAVGRLVLLPAVSDAIGADVTARRVSISRSGDLVLESLRVNARDMDGPGGSLILAEVVRLDVAWLSLLTGDVQINEVRLRGPRIRISQSVRGDDLNLERIGLDRSGAPGKKRQRNFRRAPAVIVEYGAIELGEHDDKIFRVLDRLSLAGTFSPTRNADGEWEYVFALEPPAKGNSDADVEIVGRFGPEGVSASVTGVALERWTEERVPTAYREMFQRLNLEGQIDSTDFSYFPDRDDDIRAALTLRNVGVSLPLVAAEDGSAEDIRFNNTTGTIVFQERSFTADLVGSIQDLPYEVDLVYGGTSVDAPFEAQIRIRDYALVEKPGLLPFLPRVVARRLKQFSSPTALVDADIEISRPRGEDAPLAVGGTIEFERGRAAFEIFPYEFESLSGTVNFSQNHAEIVSIDGRAPSGATVHATGYIEPLGPTAGLTLDIDVRDVPIDDTFCEAMGPTRGQVLDALFNEASYRKMIDAGIVVDRETHETLVAQRSSLEASLKESRNPEDTQRLRAELSRVGERLLVPVFELDGSIDLELSLVRHRGEVSVWDRNYDVSIADAGVAIREFPIPARIEGLELAITDERVDIRAGEIRPLDGGLATFEGSAILNSPDDRSVFWPSITARVEGMNVADHFMHAIRDGGAGEETHRILSQLGASGMTRGVVKLVTRRASETEGDLGVEIEADLAGTSFTAEPFDGQQPMTLAEIDGRVTVSEHAVGVRARVGRVSVSGPDAGEPSEFSVDTSVTLGERSSVRAEVSTDRIDLSAPVEQFVRPFQPQLAGQISQIRDRYRPAGSADLAFQMGPGSDPDAWALTSDRLTALSADWLGGRWTYASDVEFASVEGSTSDEWVYLKVGQASGPVAFDGLVLGTMGLSTPDDGSELRVRLNDASFEHVGVERFIEELSPEFAADQLARYKPRGRFDLSAGFSPDVFTGRAPVSSSPVELRPRTLTLAGNGTDVLFDEANGMVRIRDLRAVFDSVSLIGPELEVFLSGFWAFGETEAEQRASVDIDASSSSLNDAALAFVPQPVVDSVKALSAESDSRVSLRDANFSVRADGATSFVGRVDFEELNAVAGVAYTDARGGVAVETFTRPDGETEYALRVELDSLLAGGVALDDARMLMRDVGPGGAILERIEAFCHGGRVDGDARLSFGDDGVDYTLSLRGAGMMLAGIQTDLARKKDPGADAIRNRGSVLDGEITLSGRTGHAESTAGRGTLRAAGGRVIDIPLTVVLTQAVNLAAPIGDSLGVGRLSFLVGGETVTFTELSLLSDSVGIFGYGTMSMPEQVLDLRFRSQSRSRIPVVSSVLESVRDELATIRMTGPLGEPAVDVEQFSSTKRIVDDVFGDGASPETRRLHELWLRNARQRRDVARSTSTRHPNLQPEARPEQESPSDPQARAP